MHRIVLFTLVSTLLTPFASAADFHAQTLGEIAIFPERTAAAQVLSLNESTLSAEITARIEHIVAEPGQTVASGALLAQLECSDYVLAGERAAAALKASEAQAKVAELQLSRSQQLAEQKFISAAGLDTQAAQTAIARADVAVNRSNLKTAQNTQKKCAIRAPFPAVIVERIAHEGEVVAPGTPLIAIRDLSRIEVRADVQEKDRSLQAAKEILFRDNRGDYPLRLIRLSPALHQSTRLLEARLRFADKPAASGSSGRLLWRTPQPHLSPEIIVRRDGQLGIFVVEQNKPRFLPLPDAEEGRPVAAPDLPAETRIVTRGQQAL